MLGGLGQGKGPDAFQSFGFVGGDLGASQRGLSYRA